METIKVNMNPNPLDVQTIHASQNDGEARQWGFELHNNGELIDTSDVKEQLFFKAYKGGTEQILPENTSTPTTSPFKGDIKYPQGLLSDQEFLYRESPTEEDGLAKITDIKGNTLVWNQQIKNGNFADGLTNWEQASATLSVSNGVCRATFTGIAWNNDIRQSVAIKSGHRYLIVCDYLMSAEFGDLVFTAIFGQSGFSVPIRNQRVKSHLASIFTSTGNITSVRFATVSSMESYSGQYYEISNVNLFDLTQTFGSGNEPTSVSDFTSLFSLPYYAYNQGTLLSFNGNGIKTTNADETEESTLSLPISTYFPSGMKSAGSVYDELTETKAITRIGSIDLGTLTWRRETGTAQGIPYVRFRDSVPGMKSSASGRNTEGLLCSDSQYFLSTGDSNYTYWKNTTSEVFFYNNAYDDATSFKTAMSGVYLYYELANPTETSFTTASLVTENAEIPLSNEDGVLIGKCTEQLSSESGFFDAKIKLADEDGECYSNKIQLHIERKPS